ncbi:hypothetical protein BJ742DRAFT_64943 [Cladochytrium replicatum]|nr:hypothetical protein BJ742DRAFT_64943 [Cladochytrium replicatum]
MREIKDKEDTLGKGNSRDDCESTSNARNSEIDVSTASQQISLLNHPEVVTGSTDAMSCPGSTADEKPTTSTEKIRSNKHRKYSSVDQRKMVQKAPSVMPTVKRRSNQHRPVEVGTIGLVPWKGYDGHYLGKILENSGGQYLVQMLTHAGVKRKVAASYFAPLPRRIADLLRDGLPSDLKQRYVCGITKPRVDVVSAVT